MPAVPGNLRYFVDESLLGLGKALCAARTDVVYTGHPLLPSVPLGAADTEWIPAVAAQGLVVILRDRHVRTRPGERLLLSEGGLRVLWIWGKQDMTTWGYLTRLVTRWDDIEHEVTVRGPGPWFLAVKEKGLTPFDL